MKSSMNIKIVDRIVPLPRKPDAEQPDDSAVPLVLKLVTLDDIAYFGVGGELVTSIGLKIKEQSPLKHTFIITHIAERIEYLPDKRGYLNKTFEGTHTLVKDGCTEEYIIPAMLDLFNERLKQTTN
jgi:hypothetical protein